MSLLLKRTSISYLRLLRRTPGFAGPAVAPLPRSSPRRTFPASSAAGRWGPRRRVTREASEKTFRQSSLRFLSWQALSCRNG